MNRVQHQVRSYQAHQRTGWRDYRNGCMLLGMIYGKNRIKTLVVSTGRLRTDATG